MVSFAKPSVMTHSPFFRVLGLSAGVALLASCAAGPAPATAPASSYVDKVRTILRLEDARVLGDAPPPPVEGGAEAEARADSGRLDLVSLLKDAEPRVRRRAALGIGRAGVAEGVAALVPVLAGDT